MRALLAITLLFTCIFSPSKSLATASTANILSINTAATTITTSSFVQLSASTPVATQKVLVANETTSNIYVATGASGSEVGIFAIGPNATEMIPLSYVIPEASRVSLKAVDASATSGYITMSLFP